MSALPQEDKPKMGSRGPKTGEVAKLGFQKDAKLSYRVIGRTHDFIANAFLPEFKGSDFLDCLVVAIDCGLIDKKELSAKLKSAKKALLDDKVDFKRGKFTLKEEEP